MLEPKVTSDPRENTRVLSDSDSVEQCWDEVWVHVRIQPEGV